MSSPGHPSEKSPASKIFRLSEELKDKNIGKVVILGVAGNGGSFSEKAALKFQKDRAIAVMKVVYLITAEAVMKALNRGSIDYGVVAKHNNHGGTAAENAKALAENRWKQETEMILPVNHMLMMRPDAKGKGVTTVVTQPQAYEQCKKTIDAMGVTVIFYDDTATAAKDLADGSLAEHIFGIDLSMTAVVGPEEAANLNGLAIRRRNVQDNRGQ